MVELSDGRLLFGMTVIVAGVGPGLGRHIATHASRAGASVVMCARTEAFGAALTDELRADGGSAVFVRGDITVDDDCAAVIDTAVDRYGGVDTVVANAMSGGAGAGTLRDGSLEAWRDAFEVNLFGSLRIVKAALDPLEASDNASVVFIGSQSMRRVFPGRGPYASSKAALVTAGHVLAKELGPVGIRVNTLVPGRMWGPSLQSAIPRLAAERGTTEAEQVQGWIDAVALSRLATDEECARAAIFLASPLAAAITGQTLDANAGETMR